jgi:hypothetical protein
MKIEKRPGPDWIVTLELEGEDEPFAVSVFGAVGAAEAELEARRSFISGERVIRLVSVRRVRL